MALQTEIWLKDIQQELFASNEFMSFSKNHDSLVSNKTVRVPQQGALGAVLKNPSVPLSISARTDAELTYDVEQYVTDPITVKNFDDMLLSYDKRQDVAGQQIKYLVDRIALEAVHSWATNTGANQVRTSGSDSSDNLPSGASGQRKKLAKADIQNLAKIFDKQNVPKEGRVLLCPTDMYYELFDIAEFVTIDSMSKKVIGDKVFPKLYGFNIIERSEVVTYDNAGTPQKKAIGASAASGDTLACIAWQSDYAARAFGDIQVYVNQDDPQYLGDIFNVEVAFGSSKMNDGDLGLGAIIQTVS